MATAAPGITKLFGTPNAFAQLLIERVRKCRDFPAMVAVDAPGVTGGYAGMLNWLSCQKDPVKVAWSDRDNADQVVGIGEARRIDPLPNESADALIRRCREILKGHANLRAFGGFSFQVDPRETNGELNEWAGFGSARFWIPRITFDGEQVVCVVLDAGDIPDAIDSIEQLVAANANNVALPGWVERHDAPNRSDWTVGIEQALALFEREALEKIVLARRATFTFEQPVDPMTLTARLATATHACYHFCLQLDNQLAFLGATPERLFRRVGNRLFTEAIAGTRPRGNDESEDERIGQELLASDKDQLEHHIVRKFIRQQLHRCVKSLTVSEEASLLKLARKQHLYSSVEATLEPSVTDGQLICRLHPTPAVGGYPTENALAEIQRLEPFIRGWYAAPIGWISEDSAEFAVAIRSGLLVKNQLSLYSGAGIVPGSTAQQEWDEIEHKLSDFLDIICP